MTAPPAGLVRRYAAWSLDFTLLAALSLLVTWSRLQAATQALSAASQRLSQTITDRFGTLLVQGGDPHALATQLLADPAVHAGSEAVQAALLAAVVPPLCAYALLGLLYHVGGEAGAWQGSPGKRALGLTVARADGSRASVVQLVVRHVAGVLSWLTLNLGHALALVAPHRALHDLLSGTAVFQSRDTRRLPAWARAWVALQGLALAAAMAWAVLRTLTLVQAAFVG